MALASNGNNVDPSKYSVIPIDPSDLAGIFTTVQARMVVDQPTAPDDRAKAKYVLQMGGDYRAAPDDVGSTNEIGGGRYKYVRTEWRAFNFITMSADAIRASPPPLR
jgi:hypothetical protein